MQDGMVLFEDGVKQKPSKFWGPLRGGLAWNDDWSIWEEEKKVD
jgi:hypothetical protein